MSNDKKDGKGKKIDKLAGNMERPSLLAIAHDTIELDIMGH